MVSSIEKGIIGHKNDDNFDISVILPEGYHAENLKGKVANFVILLKKVEQRKRKLPELTADFIKCFGITDGPIEGLSAEVHRNMERELKNIVRNRVNTQIINGLLNANDIDVPEALVKGKSRVLKHQVAQSFGYNEKQVLELPC